MRDYLINFDFWINSLTNWQYMIFMVLFICFLFTTAMITYWITMAVLRVIHKQKQLPPFIDDGNEYW